MRTRNAYRNLVCLAICVPINKRMRSYLAQAHSHRAPPSMILAPPMRSSEIMASNIDEWCSKVWPHLKLRPRTVLQVGISRLERGMELVIPITYPDPWHGIPPNTELVYHGANPMMLHEMLANGLLPSKGKEGYVGVWASRADFTAFGYPNFLSHEEGVPVTADGPHIRVMLEVSVAKTSIIKAWKGKKRTDGFYVNSQVCAQPNGIRIEKVRLICTRPKGTPETDGTQARIHRKRKFDKYVEDAEKMYMKCPLMVAWRRRLWGVRARRPRLPPLPAPMNPGLIRVEQE